MPDQAPPPPPAPAITALLQAWAKGSEEARAELFAILHGELRRQAGRYMRRERPGHTLQPSGLVNEAYLRLAGSPDLDWNIPGDTGVLPWIGHKTGHGAIADFIRDTQTMIQRESLEIHDVLASNERAVIVGHLKTRITSTGKLIDGAFAIVLTFEGDRIASFLMLEDSFATSQAARR